MRAPCSIHHHRVVVVSSCANDSCTPVSYLSLSDSSPLCCGCRCAWCGAQGFLLVAFWRLNFGALILSSWHVAAIVVVGLLMEVARRF
jgi:hypothetical protein